MRYGDRRVVPGRLQLGELAPVRGDDRGAGATIGHHRAGRARSLDQLLITGLPAGYVEQPDSAASAGPLDLAKALQHDLTPDAQTVFHLLGFVAGYERVWQSPDGRQVIEFIYQFQTGAGAQSYNQHAVSATESDTKNPVTEFAVTALPGAVGLDASATGAAGSFVFFAKGAYEVQLGVNAPTATGLETVVEQLAAEQYQRL